MGKKKRKFFLRVQLCKPMSKLVSGGTPTTQSDCFLREKKDKCNQTLCFNIQLWVKPLNEWSCIQFHLCQRKASIKSHQCHLNMKPGLQSYKQKQKMSPQDLYPANGRLHC